MTRRTLRQQLSDDAKISNVESMIKNPNTQINKEHLQTLLDKYGPLAYDIVKMAQAEPANLMERAGLGFLNTRKSIEYFATQDIPTETLAKAVKKGEAEVTQSIDAYKQRASEEPIVTPITPQQQHMEARIDERADANVQQGLTPTERQLRDMTSWARSIGLDGDETTAKLVEKYGSLAYNVIKDSMNKPSVVMRNMDERPLGSSKKTVEYFLENDIPADKLAKALKMREDDVAQKLPAGRQNAFDQRVDANLSNDQQQQQQQEGQQQITDREPDGTMSLNDWVRNYPTDKKPMTKDQLLEAAYNDFGKGEGVIPHVYQDHLGNPTIGNGHLIFKKSELNNAAHVAQYRRKFQALDLEKNGRKLTAEEKGNLYDTMVNNVKRTGSIGSSSQYGTLSQASIKKMFKEDLGWAYDVAKTQFPQIEQYPSDLQMTLTHAYFGGYANIIKYTIDGNYSKLPTKYRAASMREFKNINKDDPQAVQKMLKTMISDINGRNTANIFENQIKAVSDTLNTAQKNYAMTNIKIPGISIQRPLQDQPTFRLANLDIDTGR